MKKKEQKLIEQKMLYDIHDLNYMWSKLKTKIWEIIASDLELPSGT